MKDFLLATIYSALRLYVGAGLFERIITKVRTIAPLDIPGSEKMMMVLEFAKIEAMNLGETLIRAVVEVFLLKQSS